MEISFVICLMLCHLLSKLCFPKVSENCFDAVWCNLDVLSSAICVPFVALNICMLIQRFLWSSLFKRSQNEIRHVETHDNFGTVPKLGWKHKQREAGLEYLPRKDINMNLQWNTSGQSLHARPCIIWFSPKLHVVSARTLLPLQMRNWTTETLSDFSLSGTAGKCWCLDLNLGSQLPEPTLVVSVPMQSHCVCRWHHFLLSSTFINWLLPLTTGSAFPKHCSSFSHGATCQSGN